MRGRHPLDPYPKGWFAVGFAHEIGGRPVMGRWCGRLLELDRSGGRPFARVLDGGPAVPLVELNGAVLGWFDRDEGVPEWTLPVPDSGGWSAFTGYTFPPIATHPQETSENSVDIAHLSVVHGYDNVETVSEAVADGPTLEATYAFTRKPLPFDPFGEPIRAQFTVWVHGLGYSFVENHVASYGLRTRQLVMCTPIDGGRVELRIAGATHLDHRLPAPLLALGRWGARVGLMRAYIQDVSQDLAIWEHKVYVDPPRMVQGDGPITRYRRWCKQFYAEPVFG
ncbi:MAG: hypothetical protein EP330_28265 [Deltaproteobacteria bacterium]|nr:MAG: hypothetical protein EP330_28265 [Deltaproteobacteria bacterium]